MIHTYTKNEPKVKDEYKEQPKAEEKSEVKEQEN